MIRAQTLDELRDAVRAAKRATRTTVIHVETDPLVAAPDSPAWWDVPVAEVSELDSTREARAEYDKHKADQHHHLRPATDNFPTAQ